MRMILALAMSFAVPLTAAANTFFPDPRLPVNRVSATEFEVIERQGAGARDIWCAAARYAFYQLGQDRGRLWVASPRGAARTASGAKGVTFTTRSVGSSGGSVSVSVRNAGANLPVVHALQFCKDYIIEPEDRL